MYEFLEELDNGLLVDELTVSPLSTTQKIAFPLSLLALDRIVLFPKLFGSYFWAIFGISILYLSTNNSSSSKDGLYVLGIYTILINPISKGGIWKLLKLKKNEKRTIELAKQLKETLRVLLKK